MFKFMTTTAMLAVAMPAVAQTRHSTPIRFDIPASDTATALNQFARQAGIHVIFPYDAVANRHVTALRGRLTRSEALRRLIAGQGLAIASETPSMISLKALVDMSTATAVADGEDHARHFAPSVAGAATRREFRLLRRAWHL
jgi:iron complex outermembrane recepter protein